MIDSFKITTPPTSSIYAGGNMTAANMTSAPAAASNMTSVLNAVRNTNAASTTSLSKNVGNNTPFRFSPNIAVSGSDVYVVWSERTNQSKYISISIPYRTS
jgi:hypothetical protein